MSRVTKDKHYSISQLNLFSLCPLKYKLTYIEKLPYTPVYNLESGKALHSSLEANNIELIEGKAGLSKKDMVDNAVAVFEDNTKDRIEDADFDLDEGKDALVNDIESPVSTFKDEVESSFAEQGIVSAEKGFEIEIAGEKFVGFIDVETEDMIADYKLLGRKKAKGAVDMDPQLVVYEHVTKKPGAFVQFIRKRSRAEVATPVRHPRVARAILAWIEKQIKSIEACKKADIFHPVAPTNWMCGSCQFRYKCWGTK